MTALVRPLQSPERVYAATGGGGVFRSFDGGHSWRPASRGLASLDVIALAVDPGRPDTLYAGTLAHGLFRSTDAAATWQPVSGGFENARIKTVLVAPDGTVWIGTSEHGILRRRPGDVRLEPMGDPAGAPVFALLVRSPDHLWAGTAGGLFETFDGGRSWIDRSRGLPSRFVKSVALDPRVGGRMWAGTGHGLAVSENDGRDWAPAEGGFPGIETRAVTFSHAGRIQAATAAGIFTSLDDGRTWSPTTLPGHPDVATLLLLDGQTWLAGTAAGIFRTLDGGRTWREHHRGLVATSVLVLAVNARPPTTLYAGDGAGHVLLSRDGGRSWHSTPQAPGSSPVTALLRLPATAREPALLLAGVGSELRISSDGGRSWGLPDPGPPVGRISALIRHPTRPETLYAAVLGSGVFASLDRGRTWQAHRDGLEDRVVRDLAADARGTLFAATPGGLFVRPAGETTWERAPGLSRGLSALEVDPAEDLLVVGADDSRIFVSSDGGWSFRPIGSVPGRVHDVEIVSGDSGIRLYAATRRGAYETLGGQTWWPLPGIPGEALCLLPEPRSAAGSLHVGTHGRGVVPGRGLRAASGSF